MFLKSLSCATPGTRLTQPEVWSLLRDSSAARTNGRRGRKILEAVLTGDSGIDARYFAIRPPELFELGAQELNEAFEREAPVLASTALEGALAGAGMAAGDLDALYLCTCTGYLCPGVTSHVGERVGLRPEALLHDIGGLGCGAAIPTLHAAKCFLAENPSATVATVAVEISSAAFFLCEDVGVLVSACLFGDGAAAAVWSRTPGGTPFGDWRAGRFHFHHVPAERERIRFVNDGGRLRNKLDRSVPEIAASAVKVLYARRSKDPDAIIAHPGGRDVIDAIEAALPGHPLAETRAALRAFGNMSSPSVLFALAERLRAQGSCDRLLWLTGFGAGFAAYSCELERS